MPGLWIHLGDNPDFYESFTLEKGSYVETNLYDGSHEEQGKGLWRIVAADARRKEGLWTTAKLLAVSDPHLHWWHSEGPGKEASHEFNLHFCTTVEKECTKTKGRPTHEFHTDYFRTLDASDLTGSKVSWFRHPPAAADVALEVTKLTGGTPRGRDRRGLKKTQAQAGNLDWEEPDDEVLPNLEALEGEGVTQRLAELKRQTGREQPKEKKKSPRKRSRSRRRKRRSTSSSEKEKKKEGPMWFGKRRSPSPRRGKRRRSRSKSPKKDDEDKKKKKRSRSTSGSPRDRKQRRGSHADRGPYGVGQKQRYDGKDTSSRSSQEDDDDRDTVFRAGPSGTSKHLQLQESAEKKPGRLTARLLRKMRDVLARGEGPGMIGLDLTPASASSYFLTVIVPTYKERLSLRTSRELRSIAKALDLLAQGHND